LLGVLTPERIRALRNWYDAVIHIDPDMINTDAFALAGRLGESGESALMPRNAGEAVASDHFLQDWFGCYEQGRPAGYAAAARLERATQREEDIRHFIAATATVAASGGKEAAGLWRLLTRGRPLRPAGVIWPRSPGEPVVGFLDGEEVFRLRERLPRPRANRALAAVDEALERAAADRYGIISSY